MQALRGEWTALWRVRTLLLLMVRRELAGRHAGSALGIAWLYAQPLLTVAVYYLVFDVVFQMRFGEGAPVSRPGTYLIVGLVPWMAFSDATARGMMSLLEAGTLLQKNPLPTVLFPARAVLSSAAIYLPLIVVLVLVYAPLHRFSAALLVLPLLTLATLLLWVLLAYVLAILTAALRDVAQVVGFLLGVGAFLSPVLFPVSMFPPALAWLLWLNPMTPAVLGFQSQLLAGGVPGLEVWIGLCTWLVALAVTLNLLVERSREQLIDWL